MLPDYNGITIVNHKAALDNSPYPPNSLEAIRACLEADAAFIEIDIVALAADDYILLHDQTFDAETNSTGFVNQRLPKDTQDLRIRHEDQLTAYRPPLLSEVVELFLSHGGSSRLQLDYKDVYPRNDKDEALLRLIRLIEPLGDRVLVSSGADWHLRRLHKLADWVDLGFDIGYYLDYRPRGSDERMPPYRLGSYGYHDDHLLAAQPSKLSSADYLAYRCEDLLTSVPTASIWYVHHVLLTQMLADGFNLAPLLREHGVRLDAWTMDITNPVAATTAPALRDAGVDQFTSNTPDALAAHLKG